MHPVQAVVLGWVALGVVPSLLDRTKLTIQREPTLTATLSLEMCRRRMWLTLEEREVTRLEESMRRFRRDGPPGADSV